VENLKQGALKSVEIVRKDTEMSRNQTFDAWLGEFRGSHLGRYSADFLDGVFSDIKFLSEILDKDRNQAEMTLNTGQYIERLCSRDRLIKGQTAYKKWSDVLTKVEQAYGVERNVLLAIWGIETSYGTTRGEIPTLSALATLAFDGRRRQFFEAELSAAIEILHESATFSSQFKGSWAGAMGHVQFMPSTYLNHAVDFDGDGIADIWSNSPIDALASAASYLSYHRWIPSLPWGSLVKLPRHFDYALTAPNIRKSVSEWVDIGLNNLPDNRDAMGSLILPMGATGPAFWISDNFDALKRYNNSNSYALSVGLLSNALTTKEYCHLQWPTNIKALSKTDMKTLQTQLTEQGFDTKGSDGIFGSNTELAIRAFQNRSAMIEDGFPSLGLLERLRKNQQ